MYSIISHTYIKNGTSILIGDPAVCEFNNQLVAISNINKKFIRINDLLEGGYYAYHTSGSNTPTFADNLVFLHESLQPEECLLEKEIGNLCTSLSGTVFICEEDKAFRSEYCYFVLEEEALYDFKSEDGIRHRVFRIANGEKFANLEQAFNEIPNVYIADGHHRAASAVKAGLDLRAQAGTYTGEEDFNYFLSVLFPDEESVEMQGKIFKVIQQRVATDWRE